MTEKNDEIYHVDNSPNAIKPPKGKGLKQKQVIIASIVIFVFITIIALMVAHYHGNKNKNIKAGDAYHSNDKQASATSSQSAIDKLNSHDTFGSLNKRKSPKPTRNTSKDDNDKYSDSTATSDQLSSPTPTTIKAVYDQKAKALLQAAQSSISVIDNTRNLTNQEANENDSGVLPQTSALKFSDSNGIVDQNNQAEKVAFLKKVANKTQNNKIDSVTSHPLSPYELMAGSLIPATLLTGINSDLPGQITASVSRNVYDTTTGNYLLIPQGTKLIGVYDSSVAYGQNRVLMAWSRLIFPNGDSFDLEGMPGVDLAGMSGLHDLVDNHYFRIFGSALMFSLFGAAGQLSQPKNQNQNVLTNQQIVWGAVGQQLSQTGAQLVQKNINIQPTIQIRPGTNFNVLLTRDMVLPSPYQY